MRGRIQVGAWLANCKIKYRNGKLAGKYIKHFEELGVKLEKSDIWEDRYQETKEFLTESGSTYIPKGAVSKTGFDLYSWAADQRKAYKKGILSEDKKRKLDEIGYPFLKNSSAKHTKKLTDT